MSVLERLPAASVTRLREARRLEADLEPEAQAVAGRAVSADRVTVVPREAVAPAVALGREPGLDLVVEAQVRECLVPDPLCSSHPFASFTDSRSSSWAVSWSTIVPFSISNRPEHVTHTPVVPLR